MTRIIAGVAGGRRLRVPEGHVTRPTADRAREGLFSTLTSMYGSLEGLAFLDLYAGSGAVGLEAASRGANPVLLVERHPHAARVAQANVDTLDLPRTGLHIGSVPQMLAEPAPTGYDLVFLDPPYSDPVDGDLAALVAGDWLAAAAVVCVERATRSPALDWPVGIEGVRSRRYGEATLWYGRRP